MCSRAAGRIDVGGQDICDNDPPFGTIHMGSIGKGLELVRHRLLVK